MGRRDLEKLDTGPRREDLRAGPETAARQDDEVALSSARLAQLSPDALSPAGTMALQRMVGNRAVAQLLERRRPPRPRAVVQRLSFNSTNWNSATSAKVSEGGGLGVLIIKNGSPLVVKAGEDFVAEADVAAKLLTAATGGGNAGKWKASAPEARPVDATEAAVIHTKASALMTPLLQEHRTKRFLKNLADNKGVMVYGFAVGKELKSALLDDKQTVKKGLFQTRRLRKDSLVNKMMTDPHLMGMFGRASASDILLGNNDRFVGKVNLENVMIDVAAQQISLIDNVEAGNPAVLRDMPKYQTTGLEGFNFWAGQGRVQSLAAGDFATIATAVVQDLGDKIGSKGAVRDEDLKVVQKSLQKNRADMTNWFAAGLASGTLAVRAALLEVHKLTSSVDPGLRKEVTANLMARGYFVEGFSKTDAWKAGNDMADLLLYPNMPKLPDLPSTPRSGALVGAQ